MAYENIVITLVVVFTIICVIAFGINNQTGSGAAKIIAVASGILVLIGLILFWISKV